MLADHTHRSKSETTTLVEHNGAVRDVKEMDIHALLAVAIGNIVTDRVAAGHTLDNRLQGIEIYNAGNNGRIIEVRQTDNETGHQHLTAAFMGAGNGAIDAYLAGCEAEGFVFGIPVHRLGCMGMRATARGDDGKRGPWTPELEAVHHAAVVEALRPFNKGAGDPQEEKTHEEGYE